MTIIMVSATIRMQLIAAKDTINLVHLMGAETGRIAWLFEKAILNACLGGAFISGVVIIGLSALLATLALFNTVNYLSISLAVIVITVMFTVLSWATTRLTVVNQLKDLP
jgi:cell division protein FtsX